MRNISTSCKLIAPALILIMLTACGAPAASDSPAELPTQQPAQTAASAEAGQPAQPPQEASTPSAADLEKYQRQVFAMDTIMILTAYGPNAEDALAAAAERIDALEADIDPASETGSVYALNAGAGSPIVLSEDAYSIMSTTMDVWKSSGGALDPGLYPLSKAWGFIGGNYRVPSDGEIASLLVAKDTAGIRLDEAARTAQIPAGMEVGLGAVGKGYTAQAVVDLMAEMGVTSAILSLGGNVQTLGETKPNGASWQVAVQDPNDTGSYVGILSVGQAAVVTSGGYQRFFEEDGVTYIHILDPQTGRPVDNDLLSVTVVTADGARADALSTALFVLGKDGAMALYEANDDFELVLITKDNTVWVTPGLTDIFSESGIGYTYEYLG